MMGIRVRKVLGYGLTDVKCKKNKIVDLRFNQNGFLCVDCEEREERWTLKKYIEWLENKAPAKDDYNRKMNLVYAEEALKSKRDFYDVLIHETEYGNPKIFCAIPFSKYKNWRRYDDDIDYIEESYLRKNKQINWAKKINGCPYPYIDFWDNRTGRSVDAGLACLIYRSINSKRYPDHDIAEKLGFETRQECLDHLRPAPPYELITILEYCEIFSSPEVIYQIEPLIYTYWT